MKSVRGFLWRLILTGLFGISANVFAADCEKLLVPNFALPGLDTTTDLAYLAVITPDNFLLHKNNATPKMKHLGVPLPIASDLLLHARDYEEFSSRRAQKYAEFGFRYPATELAEHFRRLLPTDRLTAYNACAGESGFVAQIVRADRDFVEVLASWHAGAGAPVQVPVAKFVVTGATLIGGTPAALNAQPAMLIFGRNLDADLLLSVSVAGRPVSIWVPRFLGGSMSPEPTAAPCADSGKVVRSLFRQMLGRDPKPAELAAQTALLANGSNSVRQLAERAVLSEEYRKKFARGKELEDVLNGLYGHVLARGSDAKGLAVNEAQFRKAPFADVVVTFFRTAEYKGRFGEWTVPGAPPRARFCARPK